MLAQGNAAAGCRTVSGPPHGRVLPRWLGCIRAVVGTGAEPGCRGPTQTRSNRLPRQRQTAGDHRVSGEVVGGPGEPRSLRLARRAPTDVRRWTPRATPPVLCGMPRPISRPIAPGVRHRAARGVDRAAGATAKPGDGPDGLAGLPARTARRAPGAGSDEAADAEPGPRLRVRPERRPGPESQAPSPPDRRWPRQGRASGDGGGRVGRGCVVLRLAPVGQRRSALARPKRLCPPSSKPSTSPTGSRRSPWRPGSRSEFPKAPFWPNLWPRLSWVTTLESDPPGARGSSAPGTATRTGGPNWVSRPWSISGSPTDSPSSGSSSRAIGRSCESSAAHTSTGPSSDPGTTPMESSSVTQRFRLDRRGEHPRRPGQGSRMEPGLRPRTRSGSRTSS